MSLKKYLSISNYFGFAKRHFMPANIFLDSNIDTVIFDEIKNIDNIQAIKHNIDKSCFCDWVYKYYPRWQTTFGPQIFNKKLVEFYTTYSLLKPTHDDAFMDAAGGIDSYLMNINCRKKYLQDIKISDKVKKVLTKEVELIECDAGKIELPSQSLNKISCHHSFEHFQGNADTLFIKEVQRLLAPGGICCILPVFLANEYIEVTDRLTFRMRFDKRSKYIIDPTASLPGGLASGSYARIYDVLAFQKRILDEIDYNDFKVSIVEICLNDIPLPNMSLKCHKRVSCANYPYRAFLLKRNQ
ncbi:MAG: class I SAM-dependent methyltransferase [Planctomycetes bacterium]|nr:class I SAM-dependent methyltransferase [Planctomycetota bacterium]